MKTASLILIFLFLVLPGCKQENLKSGNLGRCPSLEQEPWTVESEVREVTDTILKNQFTNDTTLRFIIALDDSYNREVSLCNLPSDFKMLGTKVILSGKIYTHPRLDYPYPPIKLLSITHLDK